MGNFKARTLAREGCFVSFTITLLTIFKLLTEYLVVPNPLHATLFRAVKGIGQITKADSSFWNSS